MVHSLTTLRHDTEQYQILSGQIRFTDVLPSELATPGTNDMHAVRACFLILCCLFLLSSTTRNLAEIFMVLPTRKELPDYYQIIKHPVDIRKIRVMVLYSSYVAVNCYSSALSVISDLNRTCYSQCLRSQLYH